MWDEAEAVVGESRAVIDGCESVGDDGTGVVGDAIVVMGGGGTDVACRGREDSDAFCVVARHDWARARRAA
jgi:hypothetical protein